MFCELVLIGNRVFDGSEEDLFPSEKKVLTTLCVMRKNYTITIFIFLKLEICNKISFSEFLISFFFKFMPLKLQNPMGCRAYVMAFIFKRFSNFSLVIDLL